MEKIEPIWKNPKPHSLSREKNINYRGHINLRVQKVKIRNVLGFCVPVIQILSVRRQILRRNKKSRPC